MSYIKQVYLFLVRWYKMCKNNHEYFKVIGATFVVYTQWRSFIGPDRAQTYISKI